MFNFGMQNYADENCNNQTSFKAVFRLFTSNFCFARADKSFVLQTGTGLIYIPVSSTVETWKIFMNTLHQLCINIFSFKLKFTRENFVYW